MAEERPIGWWVRRLDALLEEAVDAVVTGEGLTRLSLAGAALPRNGDRAGGRRRRTRGLGPGGRGWVVRLGTGRIGLTPDGAAAHDRVNRAVGRVRRHVADGLSRNEYERTILVLSRMVDNIERALGRDGRDQPRR